MTQGLRSRRELGVLLGGRPIYTDRNPLRANGRRVCAGCDGTGGASLSCAGCNGLGYVSPAAPEARSGLSALLAVARSLFKWKA